MESPVYAALRTRAAGPPTISDVLERLPRISVITPSYNQAQFLERTITSVLAQEYPKLEYILMDGGSTDGSREIIQRYADRIDYWQSEPDGGQTAAINAGWRRARGDVLCWLNSDDEYLPGTLNFAGEYMAEHPELWVVYGSWEAVDEHGRHQNYAGRPFSRSVMVLSQNCIPQPSSFIRREAIDAVGFLDERLHYTMDLDLFMRIAAHQAPKFVSRVLSRATFHSEAKTVKLRDAMAEERFAVRRRYARWYELPLVLLQPTASWLYHRLPGPLMRIAARIRPARTFSEPLDG